MSRVASLSRAWFSFPAGPRRSNDVNSELEQLNERWNRAWLEKDAATVERLMADDYVYVAPTGQAQSRETILGIIRSPGYRLHHWTRTNVVVRMLGDTAAVIRHRGQGEGEFDGKPFKEDHSLVMVCARVAGEWQVIMEQCTANKS
jgi:uncharacterized protein (TIGR02246 family)